MTGGSNATLQLCSSSLTILWANPSNPMLQTDEIKHRNDTPEPSEGSTRNVLGRNEAINHFAAYLADCSAGNNQSHAKPLHRDPPPGASTRIGASNESGLVVLDSTRTSGPEVAGKSLCIKEMRVDVNSAIRSAADAEADAAKKAHPLSVCILGTSSENTQSCREVGESRLKTKR